MDFRTHLKKYLLDDQIEALIKSLENKEVKHALVLNDEKISVDSFKKEFPNIIPHPIVPNVFIYDSNEYSFGKHIYHEMGYYYIFEPCSSIVSHLLNPNENDVVLDIAAAPGGKSIHTSLLMKNQGILVSNEIQQARAFVLSSNVERMGRKNIIVTNNNIDDLVSKYQNYFSKIILDAPCSGSGMFRKMDAMKEDWTYQKVLSLSSLQKELITKAYSMLQEGGKLVYSTCSFSYEEDEEVIIHLLNNTDAQLLPIENQNGFYYSKEKIGIHLLPHLFGGEGHYICLIEKPIKNQEIPVYKSLKDKFNDIRKITHLDEGYIYKFDDTYYYLNKYIDTKGLHIIRGGLKLGVQEKYGFVFDHALSHYSKTINSLELTLEEAKSYIEGNQITKNCKDGYVLLTYQSNGIGFGKASKNKINNKYPKGLRIKL